MAKKSAGEKAVAANGGWVQAQRGTIQKWQENKIVEGVYLDMKEGSGKYKTPLLRIQDDDGSITTHSCPTNLRYYFEGIRSGVKVKIICLGKTKAKTSGHNDPWDFEVYWHSETPNI